MVSVENLLVKSRADDGHLMSLLEQVNYVLLSLHDSALVEGPHSSGAVIEVGWKHIFSYVH